uniref:Uncharacterized protein n=1 Tax=Leersia perrieri TaxID=77586 RepID=A0A0D9XSD6_9ORYZ
MAGGGVCITLVNGSDLYLHRGAYCAPPRVILSSTTYTERVVHIPQSLDFIPNINNLCHNPWEIILPNPREEERDRCISSTIRSISIQVTSAETVLPVMGSSGSTVPVYYNPSGGADDMLVGMKCTLEFHLAGSCLLHCPMMRQLCATVMYNNDAGGSCALNQVVPNSSWLICRIYKKRHRAPQVIIPPAFGNAWEVLNVKVKYSDFLGKAPRARPSYPACSIALSFEGSDESTD